MGIAGRSSRSPGTGRSPCASRRRGAPRPHFVSTDRPTTARSLLRTVRAETHRCQAEAGDWRAVVDGIRPVAQTLCRALELDERRRFLRHLSPRWDAHRHRVAPEVEADIRSAMDGGRLEVIAGRILSIEGGDRSIAVNLRRRGQGATETRTFARVINCTGPSRNVRDGAPPLVRSLFERGVGRPGPLALGLDVAPSGALIGADGVASDRVFAIGPMLKEGLWVTTAVRELRSQAQDLSRQFARR